MDPYILPRTLFLTSGTFLDYVGRFDCKAGHEVSPPFLASALPIAIVTQTVGGNLIQELL